MKHYAKIVLLLTTMLAGTINASAQDKVEEFGLFNHFSVALTAGTPGIGFDIATCMGEYVQVRAGAQFFPSVGISYGFRPSRIPKFNAAIEALKEFSQVAPDFHYEEPTQVVDTKAKLGFSSGKLLFDVFPFPKKSNFHVTVGFYFGGGDIVTLTNTEQGVFNNFYVPDYQGTKKAEFDALTNKYNIKVGEPLYGLRLGDYQLKPDEKGNLEAGVSVNNFRPYFGIGFGRAVPRKRIGFMFELGVQLWGTPKVYLEGGSGRKNIDEEDLSEIKFNDGGLVKTLSKITVYPCMTFRLCGRIL
ncbi:MAG: hypothetical protein HUK00_08750 [Bacteroidaceae bacterium]|nr:hypothetical protein [Bacteroidaceae bacterium]